MVFLWSRLGDSSLVTTSPPFVSDMFPLKKPPKFLYVQKRFVYGIPPYIAVCLDSVFDHLFSFSGLSHFCFNWFVGECYKTLFSSPSVCKFSSSTMWDWTSLYPFLMEVWWFSNSLSYSFYSISDSDSMFFLFFTIYSFPFYISRSISLWILSS